MQEAERRAGKAKGSKYNGLVEEGRPCKTCGGSIHSKLHPLSSELEAMVRKDLGCTDAHVTEVMKQTPVALAVIEGYKPKPRSSIPASQVDTSQAAGTSSAGRWSVHVCKFTGTCARSFRNSWAAVPSHLLEQRLFLATGTSVAIYNLDEQLRSMSNPDSSSDK